MMTAPTFKGGAAKYPGWKTDFLVQGGFANLSDVFLGRGRLPHVTKSTSTLLAEGFPQQTIKTTFFAWKYLSDALPDDADKAIIRRSKEPRDALQQLDAVYLPETQGALQELFDQFQQYETKPTDNPTDSLNKLASIRDLLGDNQGPVIDDQFLYQRLIASLPLPEYEVTKQTLAACRPLTRDDVVSQLSTRFSILDKQRKEKREKGMQQAYIGSVSNGGGHGKQAIRGRGGQGRDRGGQGRGRDQKGEHHHKRCYRCRWPGHHSEDCTKPEKDFLERCANCSGYGHNANKCPSVNQTGEEIASLARVMGSDSECDSVENQAF